MDSGRERGSNVQCRHFLRLFDAAQEIRGEFMVHLLGFPKALRGFGDHVGHAGDPPHRHMALLGARRQGIVAVNDGAPAQVFANVHAVGKEIGVDAMADFPGDFGRVQEVRLRDA